MNRERFDPFRSRLARDIRNGLSRSFIESLRDKNSSFYKKRAAAYLDLDMEKAYKIFLETRLIKYDEVFAAIKKGQIDDALLQAELLWEHELYYEMHEFLESLWISSKGHERKALQGLIRAAGMKSHAENGNVKAAVKMGLKARSDLQLYGSNLKCSKIIKSILAEIDNTLERLDNYSKEQ